MVNEIDPKMMYFCPKVKTWFDSPETFCLSEPTCTLYKGTKDQWGKPLTILTILCDFEVTEGGP